LLLLAGVSLAVILLFQRLRLPAITGFIVTGVLIGPRGLALVRDPALVSTMSEIGVALLLFTVGLEFSLTEIRALGRRALAGGVLQAVFTIGLMGGLLVLTGVHPSRAIFFGMLVALSSTAVVLKLLTDRGELFSPHARTAIGVLLVQDLLVIPFVLLTPVLAKGLSGAVPEFSLDVRHVLGGLAFLGGVVLVFIGAQRAIPWILGRASRAGSREAFLFGILLVVLGSAALAQWAGVSLALGAFLAGLMLAESDLRPQIAADVLPFRDTLASVFFIAIGMSFDARAVLAAPWMALATTFGMVAIKLIATLVALRISGMPSRVAVASTLALGQIGEFSFVLAQAGRPLGLLGDNGAQAFYAGAVFSLLLTPFLVSHAPEWALQFEVWRIGRRGLVVHPTDAAAGEAEAPHSVLYRDHVVIAGFGLNGRNVARVLRSTRLPHVVVDLHPDHLRRAGEDGSRTILGDITSEEIQKSAGVPRARAVVLALSDPHATRQAARVARRLSRGAFIVARTRYVAEIDQLYGVGANQVIPEEFETSIEIFTAVLREFHVAKNVIDAQIALLRQEGYSLLRGLKLPGSVVEQLDAILSAGTTDTCLLLQHSPAIGRTLESLGLLRDARVRLVAVVRGGNAMTELDPALELKVGDTLVMTGAHGDLDRTIDSLSPTAGADA